MATCRAVTTNEADATAASSDFLKKKKTKKTKNKKTKEKERKRAKICSSKGYITIRYVMPFGIYFCVRCKMLFRIYFCSQSDVGSFITDFPPY